jgi:hypothetical protein
MFTVGFELRRQADIGDLLQVYLIAEGWLNADTEVEPIPTSDTSSRKEVLMISRLGVPSPTPELRVLEMKRDDQRKLIVLEDFQMEHPAESQLLDAFIAGFLRGAK